MRVRAYCCGCYTFLDRDGKTVRDTCCHQHAALGRAVTVLAALAGDAELWAGLEASPRADVRELGHSHYFHVQRTVGELEGQLALERERSGSVVRDTAREGRA